MIAISAPVIGELEEKLVLEVLRSGRLAKGVMVERFEEAVRQTTGADDAVAVANGTLALVAALLAHGIGPGDEVVTSPFTFVATLNAILFVGAQPRFVDIGPDFNLDAASLPAAVGESTRAVMPVHLYGCPADMANIEAVAEPHGIAIIEDAAQALGATADGRPAGSFGTGCFSFYATKNVTTGEGGVVTTGDEHIAAQLRLLSDQGQRGPYDYARLGFNFRMSELQAAVGVAQMTRLDDIISARRANATVLTAGLAGIEGLALPAEPSGRSHVFHQYTVRVTEEARLDRDGLLHHLREQGIQCGVYYPRLVFDYDCFRHDERVIAGFLPHARRASNEVLSLPVHPGLGESDLTRVVEAVRRALA